MERTTIVSTLIIITLLRLCRTEISNTLSGSWYSANVINDGSFSPKPLTEIFSTDTSFVSTTAEITLPPTSQSTVANEPTSTSAPTSTMLPAVSNLQATNAAVPQSVVPLSQFKNLIQTVQSQPSKPLFRPMTPQLEPLPPQLKPVQSLLQPFMPQSESIPPIIQTIPSQPQLIPPQPVQPLLQPLPPQEPIPSQFQTIESQSTLQPTVQVQFLNPSQSPLQTQSTSQPNYFVFYQQAPQSIQPYTSRTPTAISQPITGISNRPVGASTRAPIVTPARVRPNTGRVSVPTAAPAINSQSSGQIPSVKIRMMTPRGSITNVNIIPSSTTVRPTTTRSQRTRTPSRINFDQCIRTCGERREPICASPMAVTPIDPDTLKGFPSTCHLACHNSFKKNLYEKVIEGRCGRLRTRIRTIDSTNKLKRDELNKAQYTIVHTAPQTVVEFSPLS